MMCKAREMPLGSERRAALRLARALKDLAKNEAWLEGRVTRRRARATPLALDLDVRA
jgi:hypothetical protein